MLKTWLDGSHYFSSSMLVAAIFQISLPTLIIILHNFGETSGATRPAFLNEHTMLLNGQVTPKAYGQLVAWKDDDEAFNWMMSGIGFHPGMGLQVLKTQKKVLSFLVQCCLLTLHDLPSEFWMDAGVPILPEPSFPVDENEWPSLATVAAEAPYRVPARLDFKRLQAIIAAQCSAAEDHIWASREDPGYFADMILELSEHRQEALLNGNKRKALLSTSEFWYRILNCAVFDAYEAFVTWDAILRQVTELSRLNEKYSKMISSRKNLPSEFEGVFQSLRHFLNEVSKGPIAKLGTAFPASPLFRPFFIPEAQDPNSTIVRWKLKQTAHKEHASLFWIMMALSDEHQRMLIGSHNLVDELERLIQNDSKQKEMITPWVAQAFSDLSVIIQTCHQLNMFHPSGAVSNNETSEIVDNYVAPFSKYDHFRKNLEKIPKGLMAELGDPSDQKFKYPSHKHRSQQTTKDMQAAEENLDKFWRVIDQHFSSSGGGSGGGESIHKAIQHLFARDGQIQRTSDWVEPSNEQKQAAKPKALEEPYSPFSIYKSDLEARSGRTILRETTRMSNLKTKTRGTTTASPIEPSAPVDEPDRHQPDIQPIFTVSRRAFKVFSTLFHNPLQSSDAPREIAWPDFLHAMAGTGFAPEKLYGSVWQFTPANLDVEQSIQFHEPHPHGKMSFTTARRFGRRLNRAYRWTWDIFKPRT